MIRGASPRGAVRKPSLRLLLIAEVFTAGVCSAVVMMIASNGRLFVPVVERCMHESSRKPAALADLHTGNGLVGFGHERI